MNSGLKYGWIFLLLAMAGDLLISLTLPLFYKGYSVAKMSISALGNPKSPVRIPFNIWMILEGLLFLLALPSMKKIFRVCLFRSFNRAYCHHRIVRCGSLHFYKHFQRERIKGNTDALVTDSWGGFGNRFYGLCLCSPDCGRG